MAFKKISAIMLVMATVFAFASCSSEEKTTVTTTAATTTAAVEETTTTEATTIVEETTIPEETNLRYNVEGMTEFEEPVLYEVIEDAIAYEDWTATKEALTYPVGACVSAISTDGVYVMQDNGYIIELACLQIMEE